MFIQLVSKISTLCDHNPPVLQTDRRTDRQTNDMRLQDHALHCSTLRGKNSFQRPMLIQLHLENGHQNGVCRWRS